MAIITLSEIKTLWSNVSNWVKGTDSVSSPKITVSSPLPSGTNNIGDVDIVTLPSLVAGNNIIGKVGIDQSSQGITNGVVVKSKTNYESNTVDVVSAVEDLVITLDFTAQKIVYFINTGDANVVVGFDNETTVLKRNMVFGLNEGLDDVDLEFSSIHIRLANAGSSSVKYFVIG